MKKRLAQLIPAFLKPILIRIYYLPLDTFRKIMYKDRLFPPRSMIFVGDGNFENIGREFKKIFVELANLQPNNRVLDVGCGIGRMAIPLTDFLSNEGTYMGFDIVQKGIKWCQNNISTRYNNFHFKHSDVYNQHYNPHGKIKASNYRFPFEDSSFDFVFLTSVFTHMLPADLTNYLSEISRVLKPNGKCVITFFILNEESQALIRSGATTLNFIHEIQGCLTVSQPDPEAAIAYHEPFVLDLFKKCGLKITKPIQYGSWCKRETFLSYQDIIIATKKPS